MVYVKDTYMDLHDYTITSVTGLKGVRAVGVTRRLL